MTFIKIMHKTLDSLKPIALINPDFIPRVGDKINAFYDPIPTVCEVIFSDDLKTIVVIVE
jgi:hypothetical protein